MCNVKSYNFLSLSELYSTFNMKRKRETARFHGFAKSNLYRFAQMHLFKFAGYCLFQACEKYYLMSYEAVSKLTRGDIPLPLGTKDGTLMIVPKSFKTKNTHF
jgi:hypothetical protein